MFCLIRLVVNKLTRRKWVTLKTCLLTQQSTSIWSVSYVVMFYSRRWSVNHVDARFAPSLASPIGNLPPPHAPTADLDVDSLLQKARFSTYWWARTCTVLTRSSDATRWSHWSEQSSTLLNAHTRRYYVQVKVVGRCLLERGSTSTRPNVGCVHFSASMGDRLNSLRRIRDSMSVCWNWKRNCNRLERCCKQRRDRFCSRKIIDQKTNR
jgi:hypothetical protein